MFPDKSEFLQLPKHKEQQEKLKQFMGIYVQDGEALDPEFANYLKTVDMDKFLGIFVPNAPHP